VSNCGLGEIPGFALVLPLLLSGLAYVLLSDDPFSSYDARNWKGESARIPVVPGAFPPS